MSGCVSHQGLARDDGTPWADLHAFLSDSLDPIITPEVADALRSDTTVDLTTIGRRSGLPRRIEIWMLKVGDRVFITGTPGPRDWYANLLADPNCTLHLKERIRADLDAIAAPITDPGTRVQVFEHIEATWYRRQGEDLETLVAEAPMVELTIEGWPP